MKREDKIEELYTNLKKQETPDLWSRIEAGIEKEDRLKNRRKKIKGRQARTIAVAAAVVVIFIISVPLISKRINGYENSPNNSVILSSDTETDCVSQEDELSLEDGENGAESTSGEDMISDEKQGNDLSKRSEQSGQLADGETAEQSNPKTINENLSNENSNTNGEQESIHLKKVSGIEESSLEKIKVSDLSEQVQEEVRALLQDDSTYQLYQDQVGKVYVEEGDTLFLLDGVEIPEGK